MAKYKPIQKIENCPLMALRNGNWIWFSHNVEIVYEDFCKKTLTRKSYEEVRNFLLENGIDAEYIIIDESQMRYASESSMW